MKVFDYKDYNQYVAEQTKANVKKETWVWVRESTIKIIANDCSQEVESIICHGTRNGKEQKLFKQYFPKATVIGTEISETASKYEMTVQHDFHEVKEEWLNNFDIVYSNSFDHSYDPEKSITAWKDQLKDNGKLYVEVSFHPEINKSNSIDCLKWDNEKEFVDFLEKLNFKIKRINLGFHYDNVLYRLEK